MIVKPRPDGLFDIELPEGATNEQNTLKSKIEALLALLKQKQSDPDFAHWIAILQLIAERGFAGDPVAASEQVDLFAAAVTRPKPPPRPGAFEVHLPDPEDPNDKVISWREIIFEVRGDLVPVPPEQLKLKADIESTLTTIQAIFPDRDGELHPKKLTPEQRRFQAYQTKVLGIAQSGLQTPSDPDSARVWLESLRADILLQEGPRIKNGYMKRLGFAAAISAAIAAIIYLVLRNNSGWSELLYAYRNLFAVWTGTMIGTWLSFGIRRPIIAFKDLASLEEDMVEPGIRLAFTGLIAITIAFVFACGMIVVHIGQLNSAALLAHGSTALLIGMLLGVSEQALPGALTRRASQFVSEIGGKP